MIAFLLVFCSGLWLFFSHVKVKHKSTLIQARKHYKIALKINNPSRKVAYLKAFNTQPFVFEEMVLLALKSKGFVVKRNDRYTGDGGIDGMAYRGEFTYFIQCKCYGKKQTIKTSDVNTLLNLCIGKNSRGLFVHTAKTPLTTLKANQCSKVTIISGQRLVDLFS
ncbi:conserved hypothetical protein [Vibrio crassostreae]|nr:conserved hypothetical protein [Vibrio crassostreae]